jgi:uncharacterized protein
VENFSIFLILAFLAEVLGTVSGFGSSILFVPLASLFFDFKSVLGITAVFHVFSNISKIALFRNGINKDIALKLGIPAVISVIIGAWLTTFIETSVIELVLSILLVMLALYLYFFKTKIEQTDTNLYIGGTASGFLAGLVGTGGALRGLTLAAFDLSKDVFVATSALIDLGVDLSRAVVYIMNGYFTAEYLFLIPFLILISILGSYVGKRILEYTTEKVFKSIVLILIIVTAAIQILKYFELLPQFST